MAWKDKEVEKILPKNYVPNKNIIGIAGKKRSGKDSVGKILIEKYGYEKLFFAEDVYNGVFVLNPIIDYSYTYGDYSEVIIIPIRLQEVVINHGWEYAKDRYGEVRRFLQTYGTEAGRDVHGQDCWVNITSNKIDPNKKYVITDLRFDNEADMIRKKYGTILQVEREGLISIDTHDSEKGISLFDYVIKNDGTLLELAEKIDIFMQSNI
jgi:hypothetical protein